MKLSIIVPVYNEEKTIGIILQKLRNLDIIGWEKEIIVVDDGSRDSTNLKVTNAVLVVHDKNLGKGAAVKTGLKHATGDYVVIQDGDLEYDPADIVLLVKEAEKGARAVYGSRNLHPERRGYWHYVLGVKVLTMLVNQLCRSKLTDVYTCYKLVSAPLLRDLNLESRGFEVEAEITVKILKKGIPIIETPIRYSPRRFSEGKKINFMDGVKGALSIVKYLSQKQ